jgi:hypothetical protein
MIEVEYDEGYEEVYIRKDNIGLGTRFKGSEGDLLRKELYGLAKKKRRMLVDNVEYELRARIYDTSVRMSSPMEARLKWATLRA